MIQTWREFSHVMCKSRGPRDNNFQSRLGDNDHFPLIIPCLHSKIVFFKCHIAVKCFLDLTHVFFNALYFNKPMLWGVTTFTFVATVLVINLQNIIAQS